MGAQIAIRGRSDNSLLDWGNPPFLGRSVYGRSGVARETSWVGPRVHEDGSGDSRRGGGPSARKVLSARKNLPVRKGCLAGEIVGAMAIASLGIGI